MATTKAFELGDLGTELVVNADGTIASLNIGTDGVTEGSTNLYFTNARARGAISVSGNLTYDSGTGVLGFTMPTTIASLSNHDTDDLTEGTGNLYFSTARARASISGGTGITYSSSTGQVELTASGVTAGSYGSASAVPVVTVDAYGRITGVTTTAVAGVSSVSYDSNSEVLTINTSDGGTPSVDLSIGGSLNGPLDEITVKYLASAPSTPIQGQFYFDSLNQKMKVYTGSAWVDAVPQGASSGGGETTDAVATMEKFTYTISSTTNAVSGSDDNSNTLSYIVDGSQNVEVYVNGIKQVEGATNDYVATTGTSVAFTYNLPSGSVVDVQVYELLTQDAFYLKTETYTQSEVNTQISTAVGSYLPLTGGTLTGDLTTTGLTVDTDTLHVDSTNNRVGIGTTSPSDSLTIDLVASNTGITLSDYGNDFFPQIKYDSNRPNAGQSLGKFSSYWNGTEVARIEFAAGNDNINKDDGAILFNTRVSGGSLTTKVKIDTNGSVGIGRSPSTYSSPGVALEIGDGHGILGYGDNFHLSNNAYYNSGWLRNFTGAATNLVSANGQWTFRNSGSDSAGTGISWTDQLVIQSNGNVGIGTSNPGTALTVNKDWVTNHGSINISHSANSLGGLGFRSGGVYKGGLIYRGGTAGAYMELNSYAAEHLKFKTSAQTRVHVDSTGLVGIGTEQPEGKLHVEGGDAHQLHVEGGEADIWLKSNGSGGTWRILGSTNGNTHRFRIYENGGVGDTLNIDSSGNTIIYKNLDINGDYLELPDRATDPTGFQGRMYYNTTLGVPRVYTSTGWVSFGAEIGTQGNPANSASQLKAQGYSSGVYWIDTPSGAMQTYCLMDTIDNGGWTLIGKSGGGSWHGPDAWLKSSVGSMSTISSPGSNSYACIDGTRVAATYGTELMISNYALNRWVKCAMHSNVSEGTIFNHADGASVIESDASNNSQTKTAYAWNGSTQTVYVNKYAMMGLAGHGGSTPAWTQNSIGNTTGGDYAIGVACCSTSHNGFTGPGNGRDAPYDTGDYGWMNSSYGSAHFYGLVWVR